MNFLAGMLDSENTRVETHYVLAVAGVLVFFGLAIYSVVWKGAAFDPSGYGQGLGATLAGAGVAAWAAGKGRQAQAAAVAGGGGDGNAPPS